MSICPAVNLATGRRELHRVLRSPDPELSGREEEHGRQHLLQGSAVNSVERREQASSSCSAVVP
jgi:hypothetical protein